jgi:hypothetical protein
MMIHNGHLDSAVPGLFTFPRAWVCFECGCSMFTLAQNELFELKEACMHDGAHFSVRIEDITSFPELEELLKRSSRCGHPLS